MDKKLDADMLCTFTMDSRDRAMASSKRATVASL
jgi:hypothetical protein